MEVLGVVAGVGAESKAWLWYSGWVRGNLMKPIHTLAETKTPDGAAMLLQERDGEHFISVNGQPLMSTRATGSEGKMAELGCRPGHRASARVLIGGLGFGFTLKRVLEVVGPEAVVHVAELMPEVVAWNRELLGEVNGKLLGDKRVEVFTEDVYRVLERACGGGAKYDAILLDVDNGPVAMVHGGNDRLYGGAGLGVVAGAMAEQARAVFWSAAMDRAFEGRLKRAGFSAEAVGAKAYPQAKRFSHTLYVASAGRRGGGSRAGVRGRPRKK